MQWLPRLPQQIPGYCQILKEAATCKASRWGGIQLVMVNPACALLESRHDRQGMLLDVDPRQKKLYTKSFKWFRMIPWTAVMCVANRFARLETWNFAVGLFIDTAGPNVISSFVWFCVWEAQTAQQRLWEVCKYPECYMLTLDVRQ